MAYAGSCEILDGSWSILIAMKLAYFPAFALMLCLATTAGGATIYKSVDGQGRVTFSDQPPAEGKVVSVMEYRESQAGPSALDQQRIEAMREVTDRMAADRREREASRARARAARQTREPEPYYRDYDGALFERYSVGYSGYYPAYPRRVLHKHPGHRPPGFRPGHGRPPIYRPRPERPSHTAASAGFNPYPASLVRRHYTSAARRVFYNEPYPGR